MQAGEQTKTCLSLVTLLEIIVVDIKYLIKADNYFGPQL